MNKTIELIPPPPKPAVGFTLIELLVVISIIALMIGILLPALAAARESANSAKSMSNMRQIALGLQMYADQYRGLFPHPRDQPTDPTWLNLIQQVIDQKLIWRDPSDNSLLWTDPVTPRVTSYGINAYLTPNHPPYWGNITITQVARPSNTVGVAELNDHITDDHFTPMFWGDPSLTPVTGVDPLGNSYDFTPDRSDNWDSTAHVPRSIANTRHNGASNYAFLDGHAATLQLSQTWQYTVGGSPTLTWYDPKK